MHKVPQPPIPVYPHVYPPKSPIPETQHPCGFPADLPEQVQNIERATLPCRQPGPADRTRRRPSSAQRVAATHPARDPNSQRPAPAGSAAVSVSRSSRGAALKLRPPSRL